MKKKITCRIVAAFIAATTSLTCTIPAFSSLPVSAVDAFAPELNSEGYYEIGDKYELYWFAEQVNDGETEINAVLTDDIEVNEKLVTSDMELNRKTLEGVTFWDMPKLYEGVFDGNGHTISGLYCDGSETESGNAGFVGELYETGVVRNLKIDDSYFIIDGTSGYAGGIAGINNCATIEDCLVSSSVVENVAQSNYSNNPGGSVGGITGRAIDCIITESGSTGNRLTGDYVGGIAGTTYQSPNISKSFSSSTVQSYIYGGGIVGALLNSTPEILNCYNIGDIEALSSGNFTSGFGYGGIIGQSTGTTGFLVQSCYTVGDVYGTTSSQKLLGIFGTSGGTTGSATVDVIERSFVDCYYLSSPDETTNDFAKTAEQFASGEVCWLMQGNNLSELVWGQEIGVDQYPVLNVALNSQLLNRDNAPRVYRTEWITTVNEFSNLVEDDENEKSSTSYTYNNSVIHEQDEEDGYNYSYSIEFDAVGMVEIQLPFSTQGDLTIYVEKTRMIELDESILSEPAQFSGIYGKPFGANLLSYVLNRTQVGSLTFEIDTLPSGLSCSKSGLISGTPTAIYPDGLESVVNVTAENGATCSFDVVFTIVPADASGYVTVSEDGNGNTYYEGEAYPDPDDFLSADISGTFEWDEDGVLEAGDNELGWTFTPDSENYEVVTGTVIVNAQPIVRVATEITLLNGVYGDSFESDLSDYVYNAEDVGGVTYDIDTLPEGLELDSDTGVVSGIPSKIYPDGFDAIVSVTAGNGSEAEFPISFVISIAEVNIEVVDEGAVYYEGDPVPDVEDILSADVEGTLTWVDEPDALDAGEVTLTYEFTPEDTANYGIATGTVTLDVLETVKVATDTVTLTSYYDENVSEDMSNYVVNADSVGGVTYSVNILPSGLDLDFETGMISGSPIAIYPDGLNSVVTVNAGNGSTAQIVVKIVVKKADPTISDIELVEIPIYYEGDDVPSIDDILSSDVPGTITWDEPDGVLEAGDNELDWTFIPDDTDHYNGATGTVQIHAESRIHVATDTTELTGVYGEPFEKDLFDYVLNAEDVDGVTYSVDKLPRGLEVDEETGLITGVPTAVYLDGFDVVLTMTAGNGDIATLDLVIVISKAKPNVDVIGDLSGDFTEGDLIPDVEDILSADVDGTFTWDDPDGVLDAGENELGWTFTPDDTDHYSPVTGTVVIDAVEMTTTTEATTTTTTTTTTEATTTTESTSTIETTSTSRVIGTTATRGTPMYTSTTTTETTTTTTTTTTTETTTTTTMTTTTETTTTTTTATTTMTTTIETTTTTTTTTTTETTTTTTETTTATETTTTTTEETTETTVDTTTESTTGDTTEPTTTTTMSTTTVTTSATTTATTAGVTTPEVTVMKGDADVDGKITINDAYLILLVYANRSAGNDNFSICEDKDLEPKVMVAIDVDEDGVITINDAYLTLVYYANQSAGNSVTWDQLLADKNIIYR